MSRRVRNRDGRRKSKAVVRSGDGVEALVQNIRSDSTDKPQQPSRRDIALLKHQHEQHIRSLKQNYELRIQKLKEAHSQHVAQLEKDITDHNREAIGELKQKQDLETNEEIEKLRHELAEQMAFQTAAYEQKMQDLSAFEAQLQEEKQEVYDVTDELATTKAQLKAMKHEYQSNMNDLKNALEASQEHLQMNYELISALKSDKEKLMQEVDRLQTVLSEQESGVRSCANERKDLERKADLQEVDSRSYKERMHEIIERENGFAKGAQDTQSQIMKNQDHIEQCAAATRQAQEQMEMEKSKHMELRQEYQDHLDRLQSLNEALERCKQKNISTNEVLKEMNDRYAELKAHSEALMNEYSAYRREHEATHRISEGLTVTPEEAEGHAARMNALHSHAHNSLEACSQKCDACIVQSRQQEAYIKKLEDEIYKAIRIIRGSDKHTSLSSPEETIVREHAMRDLQRELELIRAENASLKDQIKAFDDHKEVDERMSRRHSNLKTKHATAMEWITEMKAHHADLHEVKARLAKDMEQVNVKLNAGEESMQRAAMTIRELEKQIVEQRNKVAQCLYPGERERLSAQLDELIRDRNSLRDKMSASTSEHAQLNQRLQQLAKENEELRVIKQRFEMDAEQMQRIVGQSSELNVELVNTRRLLDKKEKQLELLSGQLATMIHRTKTLEERERTLEQKLQQSTGPDEVTAIMGHLTSCRAEMKKYSDKYAAMQAASEMMKAQLHTNQVKMESIMHIVQDAERAQAEWHRARQEQERLQAALKDCSQQKHVSSDQLQQRIDAMEQVYSQSVQSHERMMAESNARIAELQQQLAHSTNIQKDVMERGVKPEQMPMTRDDRVTAVEGRVDAAANRAKSELHELSRVEAAAQNPAATTDVAIKAAKLESVEDLQRLKALHQQNMRDKERQIMAARDETYDKLLETLDVANRDPNVKPEDLYSQIRDIRVRGAAREQQVMSDMLRLRAINARLSAEYQAARMAQAELLHKANVGQRQQILQIAGEVPPSLLQQNAQAYQALMGAHRDYIMVGSRDVGSQLAEQTQYIKELERQYPKMEAIVASTNLQRFPNLDVLQNQVSQEKKFTVGAINFERKEAVSQDRTQSALEAQLKSADASVRAMTDMVRRYVSQPTPDNLTNLRSMAQMSPGQIQEEQKRQAELRDRSVVRSQAIIQPRRPQDGPPGSGLAADMATAEIHSRSAQASPQTPPNKHFLSSVSVWGEPTKTFAPTVERAVSQLREDQDLIAIAYSFELTSQPDRPLKYVLFENALKAIFPRIQQLTRDGRLEMQLVKIRAGNVRFDVFKNDTLATGCTYETCQSTKVEVRDVQSVQNLVNQLRQEQFTESENHMVLSIGAPGSSAHIHITDVLFVPTKNQENPIPELDQIRLMDGSWRNYLINVLQKPKTKIDLIFSVIPHAADDRTAQEANNSLLQVMDRVQNYLRQVKEVRQ